MRGGYGCLYRNIVDRGMAEALQSDPAAQLIGLPAACTRDGPRTVHRCRILTLGVVTKLGAGQYS